MKRLLWTDDTSFISFISGASWGTVTIAGFVVVEAYFATADLFRRVLKDCLPLAVRLAGLRRLIATRKLNCDIDTTDRGSAAVLYYYRRCIAGLAVGCGAIYCRQEENTDSDDEKLAHLYIPRFESGSYTWHASAIALERRLLERPENPLLESLLHRRLS
jgi:hypothetical protein